MTEVPYAFTNGTTADADEVNANFDALTGSLDAHIPAIYGDGSDGDATISTDTDETASIIKNYDNLTNMTGERRSKINQILQNWIKGTVVLHSWLKNHGVNFLESFYKIW